MKILVAGLVGSTLTLVLLLMINPNFMDSSKNSGSSEEPLYWVAPMDPNFRRDEPGQSPMGMDLVAVYASKEDAGVVKISPEVVNNLGVRTQRVTRGRLENTISTVGYVMYDEDQLLHIHPRVEGWIEKLYVKAEGDPVKKGQALYDIYSPALVNAQEELLLALERNNTRLISAAEERLSALQLPKSAIKRLKKTRKLTQNITFYAPQDGVLDNLSIREGFFVKPGSTLLSIAKLDQVWVEAQVFERQSALVKIHMPVTMSLAYLPGKTWYGQVDYIYPSVDEMTRTIKLRLRFDNSERILKPNMYADVNIQAQGQTQRILVPREAVIRTGESDRIVRSMGEGRYKSVQVLLGSSDQESIEILSGVSVGDEVVTSAHFLLDSESNNAVDFRRMDEASDSSVRDDPSSQRASTKGLLNLVDHDKRILNISREAIEKWRRPAATLDFLLAEEIDIADFSSGQLVSFSFEVVDGDFIIQEIHHQPAQNKMEPKQ